MNKIDKFEKKLLELENRISKLEGNSECIKNESIDELSDVGIKLQGKIDVIGSQRLIIIALRVKPKQSKSDLLDILLTWGIGKTIHGWFRGSNFNSRLLDKGLLKKVGINSNDKDLFSLTTSKGIPKADELIQKYELS